MISDFFASYGNYVGETAVFDGSDHTRDCFHRQLVNGSDMRFYSVKSCLYAALSDFVTQIKPVRRETDMKLPGKLMAWLMENAVKPVTLTDAADALGYAENYLSHQITKLFGMNFRNLLGCLRAERAKELLINTDKNVLQIAYECGFTSDRSFTRSFKRVTNQTPGQYRLDSASLIANMQDDSSWSSRW